MSVNFWVTMSGRNFGDYEFNPKKMTVSRTEDEIVVSIIPRKWLWGGKLVEGAQFSLTIDEAYPLSRALQNLLEGRVESEEVLFPSAALRRAVEEEREGRK